MTPFEAYKMYVAIKLHFNSPYDYFKYKGKTQTINEAKFEGRNDWYFFHKIAKHPDPQLLMANAFFEKADAWVGNLLDDEWDDRYKRSRKVVGAMSHHLTQQLAQYDNWAEALEFVDTDWPSVYANYKSGEVDKEVLIVINNYLDVFDYWNTKMGDDPIWEYERNRLEKFAPFIKYDKPKLNELMFTLFKD